MRSFIALSLPVAFAASVAVRDVEWSYMPDKTADWYRDNGKPLPELAPDLTTVEESQSYIVKLDCLGCPFRVRRLGEVYETWEEPARENSLLLNFTIDAAEPTLLLNGERIAPTPLLPLSISAFQTPANLSKEIMGKMARQQMLDSSWHPGTKYGTFELQYEHTILRTEEGDEWIQFDVTDAHRRGLNPGSAKLDKEGQKMVQVKLLRLSSGQDNPPTTLSIADIQVVEHKDRVQPMKMKCGKLSATRTKYNPTEWDYYGRFGSWTRSWHLVLWRSLDFFERTAPLLIIFSVILGVFGLVRWVKKRNQKRAVALAKDDAEATLLAPGYEDAPEYDDDPENMGVSDNDQEKE